LEFKIGITTVWTVTLKYKQEGLYVLDAMREGTVPQANLHVGL